MTYGLPASPSRLSRAAIVLIVLFLLIAAMFLLMPPTPAAAGVCPLLTIDPPTGQSVGEEITITGSGFSSLDSVIFTLGGESMGVGDPDFFGNLDYTTTIPEGLAVGTHTLEYEIDPFFGSSTLCSMDYDVVFEFVFTLPTGLLTTLPTLLTLPSGVTILPTTSAPTTAAPTTAAPTTAAPTTAAPTTAAPTTAAPTTAPPATEAPDDTALVAGEQSEGGGGSGVLIGVLIGLAAAAVLAFVWMLGRRQGKQPSFYQVGDPGPPGGQQYRQPEPPPAGWDDPGPPPGY